MKFRVRFGEISSVTQVYRLPETGYIAGACTRRAKSANRTEPGGRGSRERTRRRMLRNDPPMRRDMCEVGAVTAAPRHAFANNYARNDGLTLHFR